MAVLNQEISNLCVGKPVVRSLPLTAEVGDAVSLLKRTGESHVSVWCCDHCASTEGECRCVGKVCMVDVVCFLCKEENLSRPSDALHSPISQILKDSSGLVRHLESSSSLLEAIDYILEGAQNLIIPIQSCKSSNLKRRLQNNQSSFTIHNGREFCWLTQEDVIRFLINSIGVFSPIPTYTIESLDIIEKDFMTVHYDEPASGAVAFIHRALKEQKSVGVVDDYGKLIGEISLPTLACCDETVAAAITTLSAGDLLAYIDCGGPPEDLVQLVKLSLEAKNLGEMLELMEEYSPSSTSSYSSSYSSSDEEFGCKSKGPGKYSQAKRTEAIVCHPWSSLVAVIIQALTHRTSCLWVVEEDFSLVGIVTLVGILKAFKSFTGVQCKTETDKAFKQLHEEHV